jgi:Uncharacterised protein family (UPF0158)
VPDAWDREALAELRGAVARADGVAVLAALRGRPLDEVLQLAGDGLLSALTTVGEQTRARAHTCATMLRTRSSDGDLELADALESALAGGVTDHLSALPVDLDELSCCLEGDPMHGGGRIDLRNGEVWPEPVYRDSWSDGEDDDPDADHWLYFDCHGSRDGYRDMERFIDDVADPATAQALTDAIQGRGAFRRFRDVLSDRGPDLVDRWLAFSEDRRLGRARAWLGAAGYRPVPRAPLAPAPRK